MSKGQVLYVPVGHGFTDGENGGKAKYLGAVFRIPRDVYGTIRQLEWEVPPAELLAGVAEGAAGWGGPVAGGMIERVEVCDHATGDVWVMYRVPCAAA